MSAMVSFSILGFSAFNCAIAYIVICDQWKNNAVRPSSFRIPRERERIKLKKAEKNMNAPKPSTTAAASNKHSGKPSDNIY